MLPEKTMIIQTNSFDMSILATFGATEEHAGQPFPLNFRRISFPDDAYFEGGYMFLASVEPSWPGAIWYPLRLPEAEKADRYFSLLYLGIAEHIQQVPLWLLYMESYDRRKRPELIKAWRVAKRIAKKATPPQHMCDFAYKCRVPTHFRCASPLCHAFMCNEHKRADDCIECFELQKAIESRLRLGW